MDEEDMLMLVWVIIALGMTGLVGWVLIELGVLLHGLNGW